MALSLTSTPTQAATWHRGTPKVLRGHWAYGVTKDHLAGHLHISANRIWCQQPQSTPWKGKQMTYRSLGHGKYKVRLRQWRPNMAAPTKWHWFTLTFWLHHGKLTDYVYQNSRDPWYHRTALK
ncbi:hypothetical protein [Levilactobacillus zymae]|uniref:hypothetical protein n=1 Tax=Levilactobacillus zymae TaxID=267363 RepID=UPI0028B6C257|nr:hypothetical protein [Levilactobacillus zymae]MDT6980188.1 hypothetical protein [Levilactobacillus zymae]